MIDQSDKVFPPTPDSDNALKHFTLGVLMTLALALVIAMMLPPILDLVS